MSKEKGANIENPEEKNIWIPALRNLAANGRKTSEPELNQPRDDHSPLDTQTTRGKAPVNVLAVCGDSVFIN